MLLCCTVVLGLTFLFHQDAFGSDLSPSHSWPLTSNTFGNDIKKKYRPDTEPATFFGKNFDSDGFVLDGRSFADVKFTDPMTNQCILAVCVTVDAASDGVLFQYAEKNSGAVTLTVYIRDLQATCIGQQHSETLPLVPGQSLVIMACDNNGESILFTSKRTINCGLSQLQNPGTMRLGAAFNYTGFLEGKISCLRTYKKYVAPNCLTSKIDSCSVCARSDMTYKEPPDTTVVHNKGYFDLVKADHRPACNDCVFLRATVPRQAECGTLCLQHSFCKSFAVGTQKKNHAVDCALYPYTYGELTTASGVRYYTARRLEP